MSYFKVRRIKDIIKESEHTKTEEAYVKFPREEPVDVTGNSGEDFVELSPGKEYFSRKNHPGQRYTSIHTHLFDDLAKAKVFASADDIYSLMNNPHAKTGAIAYKSKRDGEIAGYLVIKKGKLTPKIDLSALRSSLYFYQDSLNTSQQSNAAQSLMLSALRRIAREYHLKVRVVPAKGYKFNSKDGFTNLNQEDQSQGHKKNSLEHRVTSAIAVLGFAGSLLFLSSNITGNAIADLSVKTSSSIGIVLFAIALISGFFWLRNRKKR